VSTVIEAIDGSQIAFQNSQLFTKNYKNMTRNHGYELDILEVGVAYGTDIAKCKKLLIDAIMKLDCVNKKRGVRVVLREFGDSSVVLKLLVWVPVSTQYTNDGEILETVYNTLNANGISIPFPQRDLHIIHDVDEKSIIELKK
jgi:small-conductance mechanosensitive channel